MSTVTVVKLLRHCYVHIILKQFEGVTEFYRSSIYFFQSRDGYMNFINKNLGLINIYVITTKGLSNTIHVFLSHLLSVKVFVSLYISLILKPHQNFLFQ